MLAAARTVCTKEASDRRLIHMSEITSAKDNMETPDFDLLGIRIHALSERELVDCVSKAIAGRRQCIIGNHNLHSLYMWFHEPLMREFYALAEYTHIDGMLLVMLGRLLGLPLKREHRTTYVDFLSHLAAEAVSREWRIFYFGSKLGVAEKAAGILREQCPGLQIRAHHGHFDASTGSPENQAILEKIKAYSPDILMVGMGMPRQEVWILENRNEIAARGVFCSGAAADYLAGEIPTPPRWMGRLGFEWLYRLVSEPNRLWRRYLVEPWSVMVRLTQMYLSASHTRNHEGVGSND
jgi:N-acetylglucosaminyldiphosphoundecaprenol N-acetyl-beta-D-mannosaminyltransferase